LRGEGDVDVETGSSSATIRGARGALTIVTKSGKISAQGAPAREWRASTGSGAIGIDLNRASPVTVDASTGSGSIEVEGATVEGTVSKRRVAGTVGGGGPAVRLNSRSGSIRIAVTG
jgi:DUF4097 and DUF4098 domain-containing protein YvlB